MPKIKIGFKKIVSFSPSQTKTIRFSIRGFFVNVLVKGKGREASLYESFLFKGYLIDAIGPFLIEL